MVQDKHGDNQHRPGRCGPQGDQPGILLPDLNNGAGHHKDGGPQCKVDG